MTALTCRSPRALNAAGAFPKAAVRSICNILVSTSFGVRDNHTFVAFAPVAASDQTINSLRRTDWPHILEILSAKPTR